MSEDAHVWVNLQCCQGGPVRGVECRVCPNPLGVLPDDLERVQQALECVTQAHANLDTLTSEEKP